MLSTGEVAALRDAHLRFYLELAERADPELRGPDMLVWLDRLGDDFDNLRGALDWAFETDHPAALRVCLAMANYWRARSMVEGLDRFRQAIELGEGDDAVLAARVLAAAANLASHTGNAALGLPWAERSVELTADGRDLTARYEALDTLAVTRIFTGQTEGVAEMTNEALALAESVGDWFVIAFVESATAQWDAERGDLEGAKQRLVRAAYAASRSGNPSVMAFAALGEGRVAGFSGNLGQARAAFDRAIALYSQMKDPRLELVSRSSYAHALRLGGEIEEAEPIYRETLHAWLHAGNRGAIANQLESFALIAATRDEVPRAARLLGAAEAIREAASAPMLPYERSEYDAAVARLRADLDAATLEAEWTEGRRLTIDQAVAVALSATEGKG